MSRMDHIKQGGTPFDGFLYADLGRDRAGNTVSVLSALARLGRDPWEEAAELSALSSAGAQTRLGALLARLHDIPALDRDTRASIPNLVALLPSGSNQMAGGTNRLPEAVKSQGFAVTIAVVMLMVTVFLVQNYFLGSGGSGE